MRLSELVLSDWASPEPAHARNSSIFIRLFTRLFAVLTMQRYGTFPTCTRNPPIFASRCCDPHFHLRQIRPMTQIYCREHRKEPAWRSHFLRKNLVFSGFSTIFAGMNTKNLYIILDEQACNLLNINILPPPVVNNFQTRRFVDSLHLTPCAYGRIQ